MNLVIHAFYNPRKNCFNNHWRTAARCYLPIWSQSCEFRIHDHVMGLPTSYIFLNLGSGICWYEFPFILNFRFYFLGPFWILLTYVPFYVIIVPLGLWGIFHMVPSLLLLVGFWVGFLGPVIVGVLGGRGRSYFSREFMDCLIVWWIARSSGPRCFCIGVIAAVGNSVSALAGFLFRCNLFWWID